MRAKFYFSLREHADRFTIYYMTMVQNYEYLYFSKEMIVTLFWFVSIKLFNIGPRTFFKKNKKNPLNLPIVQSLKFQTVAHFSWIIRQPCNNKRGEIKRLEQFVPCCKPTTMVFKTPQWPGQFQNSHVMLRTADEGI